MSLLNNEINLLSEKEMMEIHGGSDLSTDLGRAVGWGLRVWGDLGKSTWEECKKRGIKSRRDC
ncbi:hypothetical protein [Virgibacillus chiguensis]|uniref:Uncharacterized protein n=1 Tax=Virgibacillus chiguensis TaxID=411959 RepID=A0A1M5XIA2_9BACI|nr:hypothetical protein [Virgibacillus chiguensis]SHH99254.1 hypothetical protein SAMN05421807_12710 [Virgibacillus chiguensis]